MDPREEIISRLQVVRDQEAEIKKELDAYDYADKFAKVSLYIGKYFKEPNIHHENYVRAIFVYGIEKSNCELKSMCCSYWKDRPDDWFEIEFNNLFNPKQWDEEEKWIEITQEEFMQHTTEVMNKIENIKNLIKK